MIKSDSICNLVAALVKAKKEFETVVRGNENPFFSKGERKAKYADLATVIEATDKALLENGLAVSQFPYSELDRIGVTTILLHTSGEFLQDEFSLPLSKQDAQTGVGAITYARRAALKAVLGVAEEDDDGNTAAAPKEEAKSGHVVTKVTTIPAPKQEPVVNVPKAEIPNSLSGADTPKTLESNSIPTKEEQQTYSIKFGEFRRRVENAGLTGKAPLPINKKTLNYLLAFTGKPKAEELTHGQWEQFFTYIASLDDKILIDAIEKVNTKEKEAVSE